MVEAAMAILKPFRSYFPVRYYLNDFEFSVSFDPTSDPSARFVTGLPSIDTLYDDPSKHVAKGHLKCSL
ncbi:MAG TPA: hypothetical protein VGO47_06385 [Chlamydiales bacterium]|jgi:hypothetical protein|nr:hypothetical protein [Chlamydiales bacterium]